MKFFLTAATDTGIQKNINQDSMLIKKMRVGRHNMAMAVVCDGMGGSAKGEIASASVIKAFNDWANATLPEMIKAKASKEDLKESWTGIVSGINTKMLEYGKNTGRALGTTCVVLLLIDDQYFILNVGDSRVYEIQKNEVQQLTVDQTVVAREVRMGILTPEQARNDPRRHLLLQSVGTAAEVYPDMFVGKVKKNSIFLACSDGFSNMISEEELKEAFQPGLFQDKMALNMRAKEVIQLLKTRQETDNISVALIKTW